MDSDLREIYDTANRNNVAIYAVDPRGLPGFEFDINENIGLQTDSKYLTSTMDTLRTLAENTDGRAIVNRNDIAAGMKQITRDSSAYYLIGYNSAQAPTDGKFHEIKVRVKRPGVQVRARKGYWALNREEAARATAPAKPAVPKPVEAAIASGGRPAVARQRGALVDRHVARRERQDARHLRLGAAAEGAGRSSARGAGARVADGDRAGRLAVIPRQGARRGARVDVAVRGRRGGTSAARAPSRVTFDVAAREAPAAHLGRRARRRRCSTARRARSRVPDLTVGAGRARHAVRAARAHRARVPAAADRSRRGADRRPRVQPHRAPAGPRADLRSRRHDAGAQRAPAQPRRHRR